MFQPAVYVCNGSFLSWTVHRRENGLLFTTVFARFCFVNVHPQDPGLMCCSLRCILPVYATLFLINVITVLKRWLEGLTLDSVLCSCWIPGCSLWVRHHWADSKQVISSLEWLDPSSRLEYTQWILIHKCCSFIWIIYFYYFFHFNFT